MDASSPVSIDMPAGPSELLVIADETANPAYVASDLLSQAEHGPDSQVVLVSSGLTDEQLKRIEDEVDRQAKNLPRVDVVKISIPKSFILRVDSMDEAIKFSNEYAPEHLILNTKSPSDWLGKIMNAGSVFVGPWSPERFVAMCFF